MLNVVNMYAFLLLRVCNTSNVTVQVSQETVQLLGSLAAVVQSVL